MASLFETSIMFFVKKEYSVIVVFVKGIFSDCNNIFLWHESEDIHTKKSLFPKFQLIPLLHFQVMHEYVHFIAPIGYCVEKSLVRDFL